MNFARRLSGVVCTLLLSSMLVVAQQRAENPSTSGNAFLRLCSVIDNDRLDAPEPYNAWACLGFVDGVLEGIKTEVAFVHLVTGKEPPSPYCLPEGVENGQIIRMVLKFIKDHPDEAHKPTVVLILETLEDPFPCTTQTEKK